MFKAIICRVLSCIACLGMLIAPAKAEVTAAKIFDVSLTTEGKLVGQVVTTTGKPVNAARVIVAGLRRQVVETRTDQRGRFALALRTGVYQIVVPSRTMTIRVWQAGTAPPAAQKELLCVSETAAIRGQGAAAGATSSAAAATGAATTGAAAAGLSTLAITPAVIGVAVATAVAIPVVTKLTEEDPPAS